MSTLEFEGTITVFLYGNYLFLITLYLVLQYYGNQCSINLKSHLICVDEGGYKGALH